MTPELTALALAGLLQAVQFALFAIPANMQLGTGYTSAPRDRPPSRQLSLRTARMQRALNNHFEGLILFTLAVVVVTLGQPIQRRDAVRRLYLSRRPRALHSGLCLWPAAVALGDLGRGFLRHAHHDRWRL